MGKVGTGWSRTISSQIRKQLDTVISPKAKLTKPIRKPKATWVEPKFFADIEYRDITSEGLLRASSFKVLSGIGWVCENHPNRAWDEKRGCVCGAGVPCQCNQAGESGIDEPDVSEVLIEEERIERH
jgi:ATP dependent DNA ligase C terminal region